MSTFFRFNGTRLSRFYKAIFTGFSTEEAVSDVFLTIWEKREMMAGVENIQSDLYMAIKNRALHYLRRSPRLACESVNDDHSRMGEENNPEKILVDTEYGELIQQAIDSLPEKCRAVFRLVLAERLKQNETAQRLNISVKTVEAHVAAAYKRIAVHVNGQYNAGLKKS